MDLADILILGLVCAADVAVLALLRRRRRRRALTDRLALSLRRAVLRATVADRRLVA
jgi:hypothetical protein